MEAAARGLETSVGVRQDRNVLGESDPLWRLDQLIHRCLPALTRTGESPPDYSRPKRDVTPGEAMGFFRAIDRGFFDVEPDGRCRPLGLRAGYYCYPLLYRPLRAENRVILWREWLTHAAVVASLHLDYRYPRRDIALDVDAFDALVYSPSNQPLIAVEAKKTAAELEKMLAELNAFQGRTWELRCDAPRLSNAAKKFRGLLALRPKYFLAVAPGDSYAYQIGYPKTETATLRAIDRIPDLRP